MKFNIKIISMLLCVAGLFATSCSQMNDLHEKYLENGEIIYISKFDSLKINPGNGRVEFIYWLSDPKAKNVKITWNMGENSFQSEVSGTTSDHPGVFVVDNVNEGSISFEIVLFDANFLDKSIVDRYTVSVYGTGYTTSLDNRSIRSSAFDPDESLIINWVTGVYNNSIGTEITYVTSSGVIVDTIAKPGESFNNVTELLDVVRDSEFSFRTLYKPVDNCIDIFSTGSEQFTVIANKWTEPFLVPHILSAAEPYDLHVFHYDLGFPDCFGYTYNSSNAPTDNALGTAYRRQYGDEHGTILMFEGGGVPPNGNIGAIKVNDWMIYTVEVQDAGDYLVSAWVASTTTAGRYRLEIDKVPVDDSGPLPLLGGWSNYDWADYPTPITLSKGTHKIRFFVITAGFNIRALRFTYQP